VALDVYKDWLGIPEGPRPPDHYELLRLVKFEDDVEKIQQHYTKLNGHVRKYQTGRYSSESQELLNELARVMLCLTDPERKREYDEGLGREFDNAVDVLGRKSLGDWLMEDDHLTRDQLSEAEVFADARGLSLRDAVVQMKLVDIRTATQGLAQELGRPFVDLAEMVPDDSVLDQLPRNVVKQNAILPLFVDDDVLLIACAYESTLELEEEMRLRFDMPMRAVLATPLAVNQALAKYYAPGMRDEAVVNQVAASPSKKKQSKQAAPKKRKLASQMSSDEKRQQMLLGVIILCWSLVGAAAIGHFVITPLLEAIVPLLGGFGVYGTIGLVAPIATWFVWTNYGWSNYIKK